MENNLTVIELRLLCKEKGISGYSKLKKDDLIKLCNPKKASVKATNKPVKKASVKAKKKPVKKASVKETKKPVKKSSKIDLDELVENPADYANNMSITDLVKLLKKLAKEYYNTSNPLVEDDVFDVLRDVLMERDPKNKYLDEVGADISKDKVDLPFSMFSLDKIKPETGNLEKWMKKYNGPYNISDKLDGVSALIHFKNNEMKMYTRGNGKKGQDISHLIEYVLPKNIKRNDIPDDCAIRGELVLSKDDFESIKDDYKNARNAVAGLVNSKKFSSKLAKLTRFIAYAVINPRFTQNEQMNLLVKWKIPVVVNKIMTFQNISSDFLTKYFIERREKSKYMMDGIVVIDSSKVYDLSDSNPDFGFAYKTLLLDQLQETTVLNVIWTASKHGLLKPRVAIKPVKIGGATIKFATAFHAKFVEDNIIGPGSVIQIVRSGDVIPHIQSVLKPSTTNMPSMPETEYIWDNTNTNIIAVNMDEEMSNVIITKTLVNFFKKLNIKYISIGIVTKLVNNGYDSIIKILEADHDELANIEGIGEKLVSKIFKEIKTSFSNVTMDELFAGSMLFGQGLGLRKSRLIIEAYPTIMKKKWSHEKCISKIKDIDGFDTTTATRFCDNFQKFKEFYKKLQKVDGINLKHLENIEIKEKIGKYLNQKIVFTGIRDKILEKQIEAEGGSISSSVSKNTTLVVYSGTDSNKYKQAIKLGIPTISIEDFKNGI